ncbi:hypothetical protein [Paenibacillus sp. FJAT-27812]|uniref:hypothetical protein n=1 Tax=Paenibacillus sp. FJAT-27812 TaxID=1684143 RepID=UPI0006A7956D|nr:hypothetical protein [Paenibacillus sp. FJAT-27812]
MSTSIRSIRSIERTNAYTPVQAVSPYAYYPYRDGEPQQPPEQDYDLHRIYQKAASSAADWLQMAKQAQSHIDQLTVRLSNQLNNGLPIADSLTSLAKMLQQLESQYKQHDDALKPELWASIELALRAPAARELGLRRSKRGDEEAYMWSKPLALDESKRMKQLLLGADGMLSDLKHALTYAEQQKPIDLLQPQLGATLPYSAYYGAMQAYWPLPYAGLILNRYI